jgi:hypothetical protein
MNRTRRMNRTTLRSRLARLERAGVRPVELLSAHPPPPADETCNLAAELGAAFGRRVDNYRKLYALSAEEAARRAAEGSVACLEHALGCPPAQVIWFYLETLAQSDPQKALERWEEIKAAAREELQNGFRAAQVLDAGDSSCWERAQFLALRAELQEEWRPRNGLERQLIDQLAQHRTLMLHWQEMLAAYTGLARFAGKQASRGIGSDVPPRLSDAEAIDLAAGMVERFSRLYLRTHRALLDQRRLAPPVIVRRAGQVNIGAQQVNLAR